MLARHRTQLVAGGISVLVCAPLLGLVWVKTFGPHHVRDVTGRTDLDALSCLHCHRKVSKPPRKPPREGFKMPSGLVVSPDGRTLYVACEGTDELLAVSTSRGEVVGRVAVAGRPHGVALSPDGDLLFVSCRDRDQVAVIDTATGQERCATRHAARPLVLQGTRLLAQTESGGSTLRLYLLDLVDRSDVACELIPRKTVKIPLPTYVVPAIEERIEALVHSGELARRRHFDGLGHRQQKRRTTDSDR